jgi:hypothetical protein
MEMLLEIALGDVGNEADVRACGLQGPMVIEGAEIAAIPGATEQG